jgi:hypothetical protein
VPLGDATQMAMAPMKPTHPGGCLCGSVRFALQGPPVVVCNCHCASCRRAAGAFSVVWATVRKEQLLFTGEAPQVFRSSAGVQRSFCPRCGTTLSYERADQPDTIDLTVASLNAPEGFAPGHEVWLADALSWETLDPKLAHHPQDCPAPAPREA